ncbi:MULTISPECIES: hypothetical protein [unclassified Pseudomonas]|uniref:hypothetical protein n=1 Tax=Pseudomonas TaxID=286 RepID=UPI001304ECE5|nr:MULTISPECIES: hypothetical protein [unclassified Pseudomonas]MCH4902138.1 hypothetical protein [Pseudomonas sp. B707]
MLALVQSHLMAQIMSVLAPLLQTAPIMSAQALSPLMARITSAPEQLPLTAQTMSAQGPLLLTVPIMSVLALSPLMARITLALEL